MVKIIHCSDFHFDTPFGGFEKHISEKRKEDIRESFGKIIDAAKNDEVKIILIAGDVFDNSTVSYETISFMKKKFEEVPNISIFISPGNHDPYGEKSYYNTVQWPDNVHIFKNHIDKVHITELNTTIYGIGFGTSYERNSLLDNFTAEDNETINLMVLHGEVVKGNSGSNYNPISEEQIIKSKLDYLALGHVHGFYGINRSGNTYWSYSGCPEGRGFDELGSKGFLMGNVGKGFVNLNFIESCKRKYEVLEVDVTNSENHDDIILNINAVLGLDKPQNNIGRMYENLNENIFKIILKGEITPEFIINTDILQEKLKYHFYYVKVEDETEYKINFEALAEEYNLKGIFVKRMLEKIKAADNEEEIKKLKIALKMGLDALDLKEAKWLITI